MAKYMPRKLAKNFNEMSCIIVFSIDMDASKSLFYCVHKTTDLSPLLCNINLGSPIMYMFSLIFFVQTFVIKTGKFILLPQKYDSEF